MELPVVLAVLVAALLGLAVGAAAGALLARRRGRVADRPEVAAPPLDVVRAERPPLPDGVAAVLDAVGGPTVVLDAADEVVRSSAAASAAGMVRGTSLAHPRLLTLVRAARRDQRTREQRLELPRSALGGSERAVLDVTVAPLGEHHVLVLATDHTESARVEEMRRDFVVNVSHELKTPVGALGLLAEAVEGAAEDPVAVRRFAGRMHVETRRLTELVRDVVDLSAVQGIDPVSHPALVDLAEVVDEAVDRCRLTAQAREVVVEVARSRGGSGGAEVYGDGEQLTMAVTNLVDNAVRYSEAGTRVAVAVHRDPSRGVVEVTVKDQGIGIPPAEQERVFERFYRVDPARSRATGGTGLGLSIVKHVVASHGGEVRLWSSVGQGSTFTLRLPDRSSTGHPDGAHDDDPTGPGSSPAPGHGTTALAHDGGAPRNDDGGGR